MWFFNRRTKQLEDEVESLKEELKTMKRTAKQFHDTLCVLTAAQYQLGNDVGAIYSTLKSLASPTSSLEDDIFSFVKDDDDKGYLN